MSRYDQRIVFQREHLVVNRRKNLWHRSSPEIGSADTVLEECISSEENFPAIVQEEATAAWCVAWSVNNSQFNTTTTHCASILQETINGAALRRRHAQPVSLSFQFLE